MSLPPFGQPSLQLAFGDDVRPVDDWTDGEAAWRSYFDTVRREIADNLWPEYDPAKGEWVGAAAASHEEAAAAELALVVEHILRPGVLQQRPAHAAGDGVHPVPDHLWHYRVEDYARDLISADEHEQRVARHPIGSIYSYDPSIELESLGRIFSTMYRKYGSLYELKRFFLRPRPQLAAFLLGVEGFSWQQAHSGVHTGNHPALISGHCAQGLLLTCVMMEEAMEEGEVRPSRARALKQYAVDFGDRRVFGGVHYITDNIASWAAVLRLIPHVFPGNGAFLQSFIRSAIVDQSLCYRIASDHFGEHEALEPALAYLRSRVDGDPDPSV